MPTFLRSPQVQIGFDPAPDFSGNYTAAVMADSPSGYWKLGETVGTNAADRSGNARNGTYVNSPTLGALGPIVSDSTNTAVGFNAFNSQYVTIPDNNAWSLAATGNAKTIEAWIKPTGPGPTSFGTPYFIVTKGVTTKWEWELYWRGWAVTLRMYTAAGATIGQATSVTNSVPADVWTHVAVTVSGTTIQLYVNGVASGASGTVSGVYTNGIEPLLIGRTTNDPGPPAFLYFDGSIDEVAIYGSALSATRLLAHYNAAITIPDSATWTDVSTYCRSASTNIGRNREVDQFDAGTASVTLDNSDRRFDPENVAGPYYGKLVPNVPIRVRTAASGALFYGYVDKWPQEYTIPTRATTNITATDAFKRLARSPVTVAAYAGVVLSQKPDHYWRLGETNNNDISQSYDNITAVDSTGGVKGYHWVWGSNPTTRGVESLVTGETNTATTFAHTNQERVLIPQADIISGYPFTISCLIKTDINRAFAKTLFWGTAGAWGGPSIYHRIVMQIPDSGSEPVHQGKMQVYNNTSASNARSMYSNGTGILGTRVAVDDNRVHHVAWVATSATDWTLYVDGVSDATTALGGPGDPAFPTINNYWSLGNTTFTSTGDFGFDGTVDEFATWNRSLSPAEVLAQAGAVTGYVGELSSARVNRLLDQGGWSSYLRNIETGVQTLQGQSIGTSSLLGELQKIDATERGGLYVDALGNVAFRSRRTVMGATGSIDSQATFTDVPSTFGRGVFGYVGLSFDYDDTELRNYVTAQRDNGVPQYVKDDTSIATHGTVSFSRSGTIQESEDDVLYGAQFDLAEYKNIRTRISSLKIDILANPDVSGTSTDLLATVTNLAIGDRITVKRTPQGIGAQISKEMIIEGISHDITPSSWHVTYSLSPPFGETTGGATPTTISGYLKLDHATRGKLNTNRLAF